MFLRFLQAFALFSVVSLVDIPLQAPGLDMKAMANGLEPFLFKAGDEKEYCYSQHI